MTFAKRGDRPHCRAEQDRVMLRVWTAYRCMLLGTAGRDEWSDLADSLNIVESLCAIGKLDAKHMRTVIEAQAGMVAAMRCAPGPMRMEAEQLAAMAEVCTQYDNALMKFSSGTLAAAKNYFLGQVANQAARPDESTLVVMA